MDPRLERERRFHDRTFAEDTRIVVDRFYRVTSSSHRFYHDALLTDCARRHVLEYGCGPDGVAFSLAESGAMVDGIDISEVAIQKAIAKGSDKGLSVSLNFQVMNAEDLRFADNTFDVVCGSGILHHLDLAKTFPETVRVLKPSGRAVFIEPLGHNILINLYRRRTPHLRTEDEHPLLKRDLESMNAYFEVVKITPFHLCSLGAAPFWGRRGFDTILGFCEGVDRLLFRSKFVSLQAWQVVIEMSIPRKGR
jgi:SAM-dependent methyltransferase